MSLFSSIDLFNIKVAAFNDQRFKELSDLKSFKERINYCNNNFTKLKAGSARIGYDYNSDYIIKLAKNEKGIAQNATESDGFLQQSYSNMVAKVIDSDPNDYWILSEKAVKLKPSELKSFVGVDLIDLEKYLKDKFEFSKYKMPINKELKEKLDNNDFVQDLVSLMADMAMPVGDIVRISSWGKVKGKPVLIDYGLTQSIYDDFYAK